MRSSIRRRGPPRGDLLLLFEDLLHEIFCLKRTSTRSSSIRRGRGPPLLLFKEENNFLFFYSKRTSFFSSNQRRPLLLLFKEKEDLIEDEDPLFSELFLFSSNFSSFSLRRRGPARDHLFEEEDLPVKRLFFYSRNKNLLVKVFFYSKRRATSGYSFLYKYHFEVFLLSTKKRTSSKSSSSIRRRGPPRSLLLLYEEEDLLEFFFFFTKKRAFSRYFCVWKVSEYLLCLLTFIHFYLSLSLSLPSPYAPWATTSLAHW